MNCTTYRTLILTAAPNFITSSSVYRLTHTKCSFCANKYSFTEKALTTTSTH